MASVWSAVHETLGRPVAVKFIHDRGMANEVATARFMREARLAASVQHRFVIDIFDFGTTEGGEPYMVMELLQGEPLADRITRGPPIPVKTFVRLMMEALSGLEAVHKANIVHRDLKPENIFLIHDADGGFPKLLDFGISRSDHGATGERANRLTKEGVLLGTPWYMSPEQVRGRRDIDHRTDLYSIGVIMYETLTGELPFDAEAVGDLLVTIATGEAVPVASLRPDLPRRLSDIVAKAMSKKPDDRYDSALSMRLALQGIEGELPEAFTVVIARADSDPPERLGSDELLPSSTGDDEPPAPARRKVSSTLPTMGAEGAAVGTEDLPKADDSDHLGAQTRRPMLPWLLVAAVLLAAGVTATLAATSGSDADETRGNEPAVRAEPTESDGEPTEEPSADERAPVEPLASTEPDAGAGAAARPEGTEADPRASEVAAETDDDAERQRRAAERRRRARERARARAAARMTMDDTAMGSPEAFRDPGF